MRAFFFGLFTTIAALTVSVPIDAAGPLAVDTVALKSGRTLRGAIVQRGANRSVTMAVSRTWLQTANPELFAQQDVLDLQTQREAWEQARDRLKGWLTTPPDAPRLVTFLQSELDRLSMALSAPAPRRADFFWMELPPGQVARVQPATPEHQKWAVIAWHEGFVNVETQDAAALQRELTRRQIPLDGPPPDISTRLPALPQSDEEWTARMTVLESIFGQALDYQGIGDALFRTDTGQKPDVAALLQKVMQQQIDSVLKDLLNDGSSKPAPSERELFAPAIATAESMGVRGFRVTRLLMEPERNRVSVETRFVAKLGPDRWQSLFVATESADTTQARPQQEARLKNDPQVKALLGTIQAAGLIDEATVNSAMRTGAAMMPTLQAADLAFFAWINRYTQHVDRPRLLIP